MANIKFDPKEMESQGTYPGFLPGVRGATIYNYPITPKENFKRTFTDGSRQWIYNYPDMKGFNPRMLPDNIARGMVCDAEPMEGVAPGGKDLFGIDWVWVESAHGAMVKPGNPTVTDINEWEKVIKWPNLDDFDWEKCAEVNKDFLKDARVLSTTIFTGLFERLISFMDMAEAMVAMIDDDQKPGVHRLFDSLCNLYEDMMARFEKYFHLDCIQMHDDWGSQRAPFFSADTCREMLVPYLKRIVESAHRHGMVFDFHSCGKNELLVPCMIEAGVDTWYGQPMNDKKMLFEKYGDQICLGIDPVDPGPDATDEEYRAAAKEYVETYGKKGKVFAGLLMMPYQLRDYIYEYSRKMYGGE